MPSPRGHVSAVLGAQRLGLPLYCSWSWRGRETGPSAGKFSPRDATPSRAIGQERGTVPDYLAVRQAPGVAADHYFQAEVYALPAAINVLDRSLHGRFSGDYMAAFGVDDRGNRLSVCATVEILDYVDARVLRATPHLQGPRVSQVNRR